MQPWWHFRNLNRMKIRLFWMNRSIVSWKGLKLRSSMKRWRGRSRWRRRRSLIRFRRRSSRIMFRFCQDHLHHKAHLIVAVVQTQKTSHIKMPCLIVTKVISTSKKRISRYTINPIKLTDPLTSPPKMEVTTWKKKTKVH